MKVALCFYGQPRWIENPYSWFSHKYWIIDRYKADIFAHTWISGEERNLQYSDWALESEKTVENSNSAELILKKYKLKNYIFENPKQFSLDEDSRNIIKEKEKVFSGEFYYSFNNENNTLSQLYSVSKSISLLDEKYDCVILSRYDNYIYNFPNLYELDMSNLYLNDTYLYNFTDMLIFGGQYQIEVLNCFDKVSELCKDIHYFTPEEFKRVAYENVYDGRVKRLYFPIGIIRSNSMDNIKL